MTTTDSSRQMPEEDTLIDALRGYRDVKELLALERRLAVSTVSPPLFDWVCDLLIRRRISRALASKILKALHNQS